MHVHQYHKVMATGVALKNEICAANAGTNIPCLAHCASLKAYIGSTPHFTSPPPCHVTNDEPTLPR